MPTLGQLYGLDAVAEVPDPVLPKRSWGQAAADTGRAVASGVGGLIKSGGDLYGLVSGDMDNGASNLGETVQTYWQDAYSPQLKAKIASRKAAIDRSEGMLGKAGTAIWETVTDPALAVETAASNAVTMVPGMALGRVAAGAKFAAGMKAAQEVGPVSLLARGEIAKGASSLGTKVAVGTGAVQQGADVSGDVYDAAMKQPDEVWAKNPEFINTARNLIAQGLDQDTAIQQAKQAHALSAARATFPAAAGISVAANAIPGGAMLERALVGGATREVADAGTRFGLLKSIGKGVLGEGTQEALEEGGGAFAGNLAKRSYTNPSQDLTEGVGEAAGLGAAGGMLLGGFGGLAHRPSSPVQDNTQRDLLTGQDTAPPAPPSNPATPVPPSAPAGQSPVIVEPPTPPAPPTPEELLQQQLKEREEAKKAEIAQINQVLGAKDNVWNTRHTLFNKLGELQAAGEIDQETYLDQISNLRGERVPVAQAAVLDFLRDHEKAKRDAQRDAEKQAKEQARAAEKAAKEQKKLAEQESKAKADAAANTAAVDAAVATAQADTEAQKAASIQQVREAPPVAQSYETVEDLANAINEGTGPFSETPATDAATGTTTASTAQGNSVPSTTGTDATGTTGAPVANATQSVPAVVAPTVPATRTLSNGMVVKGTGTSEDPIQMGSMTGKGSKTLATMTHGGLHFVGKALHINRIKKYLGMDAQGNLSGQPMTLEEIARSEPGMNTANGRKTISATLSLFNLSAKELKAQLAQAAAPSNMENMGFEDSDTGGKAVPVTTKDAVIDEVDEKREQEAEAADANAGTELEAETVLRRMRVSPPASLTDVLDAAEDWDSVASKPGANMPTWAELSLHEKTDFASKFVSQFNLKYDADQRAQYMARAQQEIADEYAKRTRLQQNGVQPVNAGAKQIPSEQRQAQATPRIGAESPQANDGQQPANTNQSVASDGRNLGQAQEVTDVTPKNEVPFVASAKTRAELAAEAWDKVAKTIPGAPTFSQLSPKVQKRFTDYGENNWGRSDVVTELQRVDGGTTPDSTVRRSGVGPIEVPLADGSLLQVKNPKTFLANLTSKIQKLEALAACLR